MQIDYNQLKTIINQPTSKTDLAIDSSQCLTQFSALISNLIYISHSLTQEQLASFTMSMQNWINRKDRTSCSCTVKVGDIFYTDLGNCYKPELAFPHPVVILEDVNNMVLVAPVTTSNDIVSIAYHPTSNPTGNVSFRKADSSDGFEHECAIIISNIRVISKGRLLQKKGALHNITASDSLFNEIKNTAFKLCFPKQFISYRNLSENNNIYTNLISSLQSNLSELENLLNTMNKDNSLMLIKDKLNKLQIDLQENISQLR